MKKKISIIVPVYMAEKTISDCLASLIEQTYSNIEIILVNDASPDNGFDICRKYADRDKRIIAIENKENRGVSYTRNQGLNIASGEYIMFVDSDDWVEKIYCEKLLEAIEDKEDQYELAVCGMIYHDLATKEPDQNYLWGQEEESNHISLAEGFSLYQKWFLNTLWNKIFCRSIIENNQIRFDTSLSMGEDFTFVLEYIRCMTSSYIKMVNLPLYHYIRYNNNSLMAFFGIANVDIERDNLKKLFEIVSRFIGKEKAEQQLRDLTSDSENAQIYAVVTSGNFSKEEKLQSIEKIKKDGKSKKYYHQVRQMILKERIIKFLKK